MKKRILSWLLVLTMVVSLIPSTLVTTALAADDPSAQASGQAGKTVETVDNKWPGSLNADITDVTITSTVTPGTTLYVKSGKTLIFHGNGYLAGASAGIPLVVVEDGGQLVLDDLIIQNNQVGENGAIYVKKGGLLDLGYNDQKERRAPSVTNNTYNGAAKNIVIADGARVRLNNAATKKIGISYAGTVAAPVPLLEGGRYALTNDDLQYVVADDSKLGTTMELDTILLRYAKPQFLFLDTTVWMDIAAGGSIGYQILNDWQASDFELAGAEVTKHASKDAGVTPTYLTDSAVGDIMKYDVIMLCAFYRNAYTGAYNDGYKHDLNDDEYQLLEKYINNGGRVILQCEDANPGNYFNTYINPIGSQIAQRLGAGFNITYQPGGKVVDIPATTDMNVLKVPPLTDNLSSWYLGLASPIEILPGTESRTLFNAKGTDGKYWSFAEDMQAGVRDDGQKWGNIMALSDANFWTQSGYNAVYGSIPGAITFAKNILGDSRSNRVYAALGYNPNNKQIDEQATTTTTPYETVSKALGKIRNDEYATLLRDHDLTPVSNELLFEESTLKFKEGTKYAGTEVFAKSAGVYIDITNDGSLNLHSGTVTVTPKDENYVLTMNGKMDDAGTQITGGYKITATGAYTLDADDEKTPILAENGGGAKLTIPKAGTTVTVAYSGGADGKLDGKTVTYTAKNDGDSFYLGCYTVTYNVEGNVTWTADDLAWDGHDFVTKMTPAEGYEAKGEKLAVVDQTSHDLGNYQMENGTKENDPDTGKTDTWGVFNSVKKLADGVTPKITIRQQYLHNNNVDRNGYSTVTVRDVRANIIIKTTGDAVQSARPNIYVVGVGKRAGYEDEQLWAYTTQRTTDDQNLTKDVEGWPWANWKAVSAKTAQGTQAKYEDKDNPIVNWTTQQIKDSSTAGGKLCPVELTKGDMVVVFEYEWDMVDVKINAKLGSSADPDSAVDFPGYIPQYAELQRDVKGTIYAPNLSGYQPDQTSQEFTPTQTSGQYGPYEVTFYYTMAMGQVVYRAVDEADHELATWDGPRVMQGDAVSTDWKLAPDLAGYQVKQVNGTALDADGQPATKYDGKQITVTWVYESKTRDVEIKMVEYTADGDHRGAELRTDTTSYAKSPVGFTLNLTAPAIPGYTVKGIENDNEVCASKSVFVDDTATGKITVYFYYEVNTQDDAKITVQMWDKVNNAEIWSYTVPGQNGEKQLVRVPAVKGYVSDPANKDVSIAPDETINNAWGKGTVRFLYSPNTVKVTVKLVDSTKTVGDQGYELNTKVPNYTGSYTVVKGESIDIVAPDIYGYTLADGQDSVHKLTVDQNESKTELTYTIRYIPASANYVTHTIKLMDADKTPAMLITQYNSVVTKGNGTTTYLAPLQDGYQVDKKSQEISNAASQDVVFNYTKSAATITIHFVDTNGTTLTGYENGQILTGYEKGQTVMVAAPAVSGKALAGLYNATAQGDKVTPLTGVTTIVTIPTDQSNVDVTFAYKEQGTYKFHLVDQAGTEIKTVTGENGTFSTKTGENLDLTDSGWKFDHTNKGNTDPFNAENAELKIGDDTTVKEYTLYYTRMTRYVTYKYVYFTDGKPKDINFTGTTNNPETTNVGENLITSAPQIPGYTPNALRNVTFVMTGTDAVTVTFEYTKKATGNITVVHKLSGSDKVITSYTVSGSVGEWFTATKLATNNATGITTDGKYKFTESPANQATQSVQYTADAQTITFVYEANYVTVDTHTSIAGQETDYETGIEVVKTTGTQKLYAPSKTGYVLKGITVTSTGSTGIEGGTATTLPTKGWRNNTLTLSGLTDKVDVVYYYEKINDNIKEYQATVSVTDKYASYELGTWTETVTKDVESTITPKPHDGYILSGYQIGDSADQKQTITKEQAAKFVLTHNFTADTNVTFFYDRADGSAVVPGQDTIFGNEDDVIIKPNGDQLPKVNDDKTVSVPEGGEVVTPNGTVIPPNGSIVKPDGTIVAPGTGGTTNPGVTIDPSNPDSAKATYLYVKYLANGGKGEVATRIVKKGTEITIANNTLTRDNWTAAGWNTQENGAGTDYADGKTLPLNESLTLYAKWTKDAYKNKVTITFNSNTGDNSQTKTQVIGSDTSTAFGGKLNANTFALDGWTFRGWNTAKDGSGTAYTNEQEVTFTSASGDTLNLYAQWYRFNADGSITIPGKDSTPNTNKDVTIHPNGNDRPSIDDKGNVKVPNGAEVTTPNGTIIPPDGSVVKPDGTIVAPDDTGSTEPGIEIDPSKPGDATNKFITVTYKYGRTDKQVADVTQYGKGTVTIMTGNPFTAPTGYQFDGWKVEGSDDKFTGTTVNATTTLVAQWKLAGSVVLAPDKTTESGKRLETGAKAGELKLVMRGDWAQDKTLTLGALVDGKQSTNEVYWRVDADSYKNEFGFTNSVLSGDQIVSVDANTGKLTVLNSGIVRVWCISKVNPDIKFSVVVVVPGDVNKDGLVDADDIDWTYCAMADPNFIPTQDEDDAKTWYIKDLAILHSTAADKEIGADDIDCLYNILFGIYGF